MAQNISFESSFLPFFICLYFVILLVSLQFVILILLQLYLEKEIPGIERGNKGHRRNGCFGIQMSAISSDVPITFTCMRPMYIYMLHSETLFEAKLKFQLLKLELLVFY
jgi:hypothetical protein